MSDDVAPAVEQDQPIDAPEAPETDQPTGSEESFTDFDPSQIPDDADREWLAERYKQMQGDYSRKTMEIGEVRREAERAQQIIDALQNPRVAPAVLAQLGYDDRRLLEMYGYDVGDQEDDEFDEFDTDDRVELLEQRLNETTQAFEQRQREEAVTDYIAGEIEALEKKANREFDAEEHQLLDTHARANPRADGSPDVEGAYNLLSGIVSNREKAFVESKKSPRAPGRGKPGSRQVDLSKESREERLERMAHAGDEARGSLA